MKITDANVLLVLTGISRILELALYKEENKSLIVIGLATFQRPAMLRRALESLQSMRIPQDVSVKLILIDNDLAASAEVIYREYSCLLPFESEYHIETRRGFANVHNNILSRAMNMNAQYIAFMGDDQQVSENWLRALYSTIASHHSHAVSGRIIYEFPEETAEWIQSGRFFRGKNLATGSAQNTANANNVLVDLNFVKENYLNFHHAFNLLDGGDSYFFTKIIEHAGKIVWCQEAVTHEKIPHSRLTESCLLAHAYNEGYATLLRACLDKRNHNTLVLGFQFILAKMGSFLNGVISEIYQSIINGNHSSWINSKQELYKIKGAYEFLRGSRYAEYQYILGY